MKSYTRSMRSKGLRQAVSIRDALKFGMPKISAVQSLPSDIAVINVHLCEL